MSEVFRFEQKGVDANGRVIGELIPTGVTPRFVDKIKSKGVAVPEGLFVPPGEADGAARRS